MQPAYQLSTCQLSSPSHTYGKCVTLFSHSVVISNIPKTTFRLVNEIMKSANGHSDKQTARKMLLKLETLRNYEIDKEFSGKTFQWVVQNSKYPLSLPLNMFFPFHWVKRGYQPPVISMRMFEQFFNRILITFKLNRTTELGRINRKITEKKSEDC